MEYLQNALNRYRVELKSSLEEKNSDMPEKTKKQKNEKKKKEKEMILYKKEAFDGDSTLLPKGKHAAAYCQGPPPAEFEDEGLSHINCAQGKCDDCPDYCRPVLETKLKGGDKKNLFL